MSRGTAALVRGASPDGLRRRATSRGAEVFPFVSVIVPVYNDARRLAACLDALAAQSYPASRFEVIVVDNGSTDRPDEAVARFPGVRFLHEGTPASYAARHRALAAAAGEILAFMDADCVPDTTWLEHGVAHFRWMPSCGLVGGRIEVTGHAARPSLCELYDRVFDFDQERFVARGGFACTANLFTTKRVVRDVGGFDPTLRSGGDRDFGNRVKAAGYALAFAEGAVVAHPARTTVRALLAKRLRVAGGHHDRACRRRVPSLHFLAAVCYLLVRNPAVGVLRIRRRAADAAPSRQLGLLGLYVLLCWAELAERVRLQFGGRSRR